MLNFEIWRVITDYYIASPIWRILTIVALLYLIVRPNRSARKKIILSILFFAILIMNDISYRVLIKVVDPDSYYRFLWLVPYVMLVAYTVTQIIADIEDNFDGKNKCKKVATIIAIVVPLVGILNLSQGNYWVRLKAEMPQNKYLVYSDVASLKDLMDQERQTGAIGARPVIACPKTIMMQYQTIDADCIISTDRKVYLQIRELGKTAKRNYKDKYVLSMICEDAVQVPIDEAKRALEKEKVDYMVVPGVEGMEEYLQQLGGTLVGNTYCYQLYRFEQ